MHGDWGRRRVGRGCGHRGDDNGSRVGGRNHHGHDGGWLRARHGLVLVVGAGAEAHMRAAGEADVEAAARVLLTARSGAARTMVLAVGAGTELDVRATGDTDIKAGAGVVLAVAVGGRGVAVVVTTQKREAVLDSTLAEGLG